MRCLVEAMKTDYANFVIVTGVTSPLGSLLFEGLAEPDNFILGTSRQRPLPVAQRNSRVFFCDFCSEESISKFVAGVKKITKRIDVLINNVTSWHEGGVLTQSAKEIRRDLDLSIGGTVQLVRELLPLLMVGKSPLIVNICSTAGTSRRWSPNTVYVTSKGALAVFGQSLLREYRHSGLRVTNVHLGQFEDGEPSSKKRMQVSDVIRIIHLLLKISPTSVIEEIIMTPTMIDY